MIFMRVVFIYLQEHLQQTQMPDKLMQRIQLVEPLEFSFCRFFLCFLLFLQKNSYFLNTKGRERRNAKIKRNKNEYAI